MDLTVQKKGSHSAEMKDGETVAWMDAHWAVWLAGAKAVSSVHASAAQKAVWMEPWKAAWTDIQRVSRRASRRVEPLDWWWARKTVGWTAASTALKRVLMSAWWEYYWDKTTAELMVVELAVWMAA